MRIAFATGFKLPESNAVTTGNPVARRNAQAVANPSHIKIRDIGSPFVAIGK